MRPAWINRQTAILLLRLLPSSVSGTGFAADRSSEPAGGDASRTGYPLPVLRSGFWRHSIIKNIHPQQEKLR
jgi:hypothetical protein